MSMVSAKPPKPDPFSGGTSPGDRVDLWLFTMERYCDAVNMKPEQRVPFAATFLRSGAATWWRAHLTLVREGKEQLIIDWERFAGSLLAQFKPVNWKKIARDKLHNLRQTGSVSQYVYTFHALCLDVGHVSEDEKLDRFVRGLKPRVQQEVELQDPHTLEKTMQIAQRIDSIQWTGRMRQQTRYQQSGSSASWENREFQIKREVNVVTHENDSKREQLNDVNQRRTMRRRQTRWNHPNKSNQLTEQERQNCLSNKLCFRCKREGHMIRECPLKPKPEWKFNINRKSFKQGKGKGQ